MRLRSATLLVVSLALVAACSGGSKPQTLPSLSPTPSATTAAVVVPSAATLHTAFGAAAFVRFYYDQLNKAWATPDPSPLIALSDPACGTCKNYIQAAKDFAGAGRRVNGASIRILTAEAPPMQNGLVAVDVTFDEPARAIVDRQGAVVQRLPRSKVFHWTVYVASVPSGWTVRAAVKSK